MSEKILNNPRRRFIKTLGAGGVGALMIPVPLSPWIRAQDTFDLILHGGRVIDGSGSAPTLADVGIRGDTIAAVGRLADATASTLIDATNLVVAPGFIDVHTHSEKRLLINPKAESKIRQGVTTEIVGMDGGSYAPDTFGSSLDELDAKGSAVNVGSFVGQGTLRGAVMGMSDRPARDDEIEEMKTLARKALDAGAFGISSGLEYTPGGFASTEEITGLAGVMRSSTGLYATHMRNEDDRVLEAVEEAIAIAEGAGIGLHISHLKCQGERNWDKLERVFQIIDAAEDRGVSVTLDRYPYVAYSTTLANLMPIWSREGGTAAFIERLRDPSTFARIREAMEDKIALLGSWDAVMVSSVSLAEHAGYQGKTIAELVPEDTDRFNFVRDIIIKEDNSVGMVGFGMSEENTGRILAHPRCMPASDGSSLATYGALSSGSPHPRSYGTFPRVFATYVRERKVMPMPEAVRKMTELPAQRYGLSDRGQIAVGKKADLVVFDENTIADQATFAKPHQYASGIAVVVVNGQVVLRDGEHTGALAGHVLRA